MEFLSKRLSNGRQLSIKVFNSYIKGIKGIVCMSVQLQIFRKYFRLQYINEGESIHYCSLLGSKVSIFACESLSLLYNFVIFLLLLLISLFHCCSQQFVLISTNDLHFLCLQFSIPSNCSRKGEGRPVCGMGDSWWRH